MHAPNSRAPKYMKQMLTELKAEINNSAIIDGDFRTLFSIIVRTTLQKIKGIKDLSDTINCIDDLTDIYRIVLSTVTFFSRAHRAFSRMDSM